MSSNSLHSKRSRNKSSDVESKNPRPSKKQRRLENRESKRLATVWNMDFFRICHSILILFFRKDFPDLIYPLMIIMIKSFNL